MGTGYVRNDTTNNIADGGVIDAADLDGEFDAVVAAFDESTGHTHDGTGAEGAPIEVLGPAQDFIGDASALAPKTTATYTLGKPASTYSNIYVDNLTVAGTAIVATPAEINNLSGVTSTTAELNILDGVTSTTAELNILDGVTSTTAELNILDGVTSTTAEINILDGVTASTAEINHLVGQDQGVATTDSPTFVDGTFAGDVTIEDPSTSSVSPYVKVIGKRNDANDSQAFGGKLLLDGNRTDAAVTTNKNLGTVYFGGNHTSGSAANILYPASISGVAEGTFSNATTMPTGLVFYTGSTGITEDALNTTAGSEVMRVTSSGNVGIGTDSPDTLMELVGANPVLTIRDTDTAISTNDARLRLGESGAGSSLDNYFDVGYVADKFTIGSNTVADALTIDRATGYVEVSYITATNTVAAVNGTFTGDVTIGDGLFVTGPNPLITLTDNDIADEYTKLTNSDGATILGGRNGASNGIIIFRGEGGGVNEEYARFNASANFGIGDTGPAEKLSVTGNIAATGNIVTGGSGTFATAEINNATDSTGGLVINGTGVNQWGLEIGTHDNGTESDLVFSSNAVIGVGTNLAVALPAAGNFRVRGGATNKRTGTAGATEVFSVAGDTGAVTTDGGIYLGGTAAANLLDDYEEGTWTPGISDGTNAGTTDVAVGSYTKTGNHVHVQGRVRLSSLGSISGAIRITGLPFASKSVTNNYSVMSFARAVGLNITAGTSICGDLRANVTEVLLQAWDSSTGKTDFQGTEFSANGDVSFSLDYISA